MFRAHMECFQKSGALNEKRLHIPTTFGSQAEKMAPRHRTAKISIELIPLRSQAVGLLICTLQHLLKHNTTKTLPGVMQEIESLRNGAEEHTKRLPYDAENTKTSCG